MRGEAGAQMYETQPVRGKNKLDQLDRTSENEKVLSCNNCHLLHPFNCNSILAVLPLYLKENCAILYMLSL